MSIEKNYINLKNIPYLDKGFLDLYNLIEWNIFFIVEVLDKFKSIKTEDIDKDIDDNIDIYNWKLEEIEKFINLFEYLELNDPKNEFKQWFSENLNYQWKLVLAKILSKIEIKDEISEIRQNILDIIEAREIKLQNWFSLYETWVENSKSVIINLPVFASENPWSLADWFLLEEKNKKNRYWILIEKWFNSSWWWRSSYTWELERIHNNWKLNKNNEDTKNKLWYLEYPKKWNFDIKTAIDEIVKKIEDDWISEVSIHWASMWWKVALQLATKLARKQIKINKIFISWWALIPEYLKIPWIEQEVNFLKETNLENLEWLKSTFSLIEAMITKYIIWYWNYYIWEQWLKLKGKNEKNEFNSKDKKYWDWIANKFWWLFNWASIFQILHRLNFLKERIDFTLEKDILREYVWEVISINSIPTTWAKSDWMISTDFPDLLDEIFWKNKVTKVEVEWLWHYSVPNSPSAYAKELSKVN